MVHQDLVVASVQPYAAFKLALCVQIHLKGVFFREGLAHSNKERFDLELLARSQSKIADHRLRRSRSVGHINGLLLPLLPLVDERSYSCKLPRIIIHSTKRDNTIILKTKNIISIIVIAPYLGWDGATHALLRLILCSLFFFIVLALKHERIPLL